MKLNTLYRVLLFLLVLLNYQTTLGIAPPLQEPVQIRQFEDNFKDKYSSRKYDYEGKKIVSETQRGSGSYEDYKKENPSPKEKGNSNNYIINLGPFVWLFYLALAIAVMYLAYILVNEGGTGLFSLSKQHKKLNAFEDITAENIENADINSLIKNAENNNDYSLAIRYYYLLILKTLSLKNYIKFEDDKTNAEYLNEINDKPFSDKFEYTSYLYNYIWYGKFPLNSTQYNKAKGNFTTLLNIVK